MIATKKSQNIQALRGVAVLSVVLFHLMTIEEKYGGGDTVLGSPLNFGMFGVDLFFVISGFVMVTVTRGHFRDPGKAFSFLYHRASRIYPVYWFYTALVLCVYLIKPSFVNSSVAGQVDIVASFFLLPTNSLHLLQVGWTLIHEMYFYLVFFLILLLVSERFLSYAIVLWGVGVVLLGVLSGSTGPYLRLVSHPLTLEFIVGCFIAIAFYGGRVPKIGAGALFVFAAVGLLCGVLGYAAYENLAGYSEPQGWQRVLIFGVPAMLLVFCAVNAERGGYVIHSSLTKIGDASYSIYLSHVLTLSALGRVWNTFSRADVYDNLVMLPLLTGVVLGVGLVSYYLIEKPLLSVSRKIHSR